MGCTAHIINITTVPKANIGCFDLNVQFCEGSSYGSRKSDTKEGIVDIKGYSWNACTQIAQESDF